MSTPTKYTRSGLPSTPVLFPLGSMLVVQLLLCRRCCQGLGLRVYELTSKFSVHHGDECDLGDASSGMPPLLPGPGCDMDVRTVGTQWLYAS